jgi:hypothetical protein
VSASPYEEIVAAQRSLRVPRARLLAVRRARPHTFSVDDEAAVELDPGLLRFGSCADPLGQTIGEGAALEWTTPVGAAGTAAYAAVEPPGFEGVNWWTGVSNRISWTRAAAPDETLIAFCRLAGLGRTSARLPYRVFSREHGDQLCEGEFVFVSVGADGRSRPFVDTAPAAAVPAAASLEPIIEREIVDDPPATRPAAAPRRSWRSRALDFLLPRRQAELLRDLYWHYLDLRRRARGGQAASSVGPHHATVEHQLVELLTPDDIALTIGETSHVQLRLHNSRGEDVNCRIEVELPFGFGVEAQRDASVQLGSGTTARVSLPLTALRADEVNLGRAWRVLVRVSLPGAATSELPIHVRIHDPEPAKVYYLLTEDCETFDGGERTGDYGAARGLGNHNDFMDPEEHLLQMVEKPRVLNRIAERHGAVWTHYWTATQVFAAEWAAKQSKTGAWPDVIARLEQSVREGARHHEYAAHVHYGFEPDSTLPPQPRLLFDEATDGFIPNEFFDPETNRNHRFHGWDGGGKGIANVRDEGYFLTLDSKLGSLRKSVRFLGRLTHGGKAALTFRTGAADFGATPPDLATSTRALFANGLLADSDAGVHDGREHPRGRQIYFCRGDDLDAEIDDLRDAALVQLRPPRVVPEGMTIDELDAWLDARVAAAPSSGVHAVVTIVHAMFVRGEPDPFRGLAGGDFDKLDRHLGYVRRTHPHVCFATATEAAVEFLDYYTPIVRAVVTEPTYQASDGTSVLYPIRVLGRGIPLSAARPHRVELAAPPAFDADEIVELRVLDGGQVVATAASRAEAISTITFEVTKREGYELQLITRGAPMPIADPSVVARNAWWSSPRPALEQVPERETVELFRLVRPTVLLRRSASSEQLTAGDVWEWLYPLDLFRLLVNPVAGGTEPLGRRLHPYGRILEGMGIHATLAMTGASAPREVQVRWSAPVAGKADFHLRSEVVAAGSATTVRHLVEEGTTPVGEVTVTAAASV